MLVKKLSVETRDYPSLNKYHSSNGVSSTYFDESGYKLKFPKKRKITQKDSNEDVNQRKT